MVNRVVTEINYSLYIQRVGDGAGWRGAPCTGRASNALTVLSRKFSCEQNYLWWRNMENFKKGRK